MGCKIEAGCGIQPITRVGYRIKMSWQDWEALILIGGMQDSFKIDDRMQDLNSK